MLGFLLVKMYFLAKENFMQLKLVRKNVVGDNQPLVIMVEHGEEASRKKFITSLNINQIIEVPDELGFSILGKYPKCFVQSQNSSRERSPQETK